MKKYFLKSVLVSLFMLSMICVTGCGGDSPEEPNKPDPVIPTPVDPDESQETLPVPGLSFTSLTLPNEGETFACNIYGLETDKWDAESDQSWCSVSMQGNILKITAMPNDGLDRSATINILHSDKRVIGKINIFQRPIKDNEALKNSTSSKHSFYPMFTATWCPYSPDMDRTLIEIQKRWEYPILPMRIHVENSELYNPLSVELSELYNNSTTPTGYFENYFKVDNRSDGNVSVDYFWNLILSNKNSGNGYTSKCSFIGCEAKMSDNSIDAQISISPIQSGKYRLLAFILEDNIIKPQMSKTNGEILDYCHNGVLVGALTSIKGQEMELTSSQKIISLTGSIPSNVNLSNLRLLVVLERNVNSLNYSDECWFADNCISVPLGKTSGDNAIENIYTGEEIEN
jgi:hypothetical protein